uniref:Cathepsin propeptide inhibitor domain-containing protein n=2 Tax=Canis lupus familiaris TaxID=9615 RepID=A0A8C0MHN1_CANLF
MEGTRRCPLRQAKALNLGRQSGGNGKPRRKGFSDHLGQSPTSNAHWSQWKEAHGKLYDKDEEGWRRTVWERNMEMIEQHNQEYSQGEHSFTLAMNAFGDMVKWNISSGLVDQECVIE